MLLLVLWSAFLKMQKHRLQKYQEWLTDHWHDHCLNLCIFCQQCYDMKTMSCSNNRYFNRSVSLFATIVFWKQTSIQKVIMQNFCNTFKSATWKDFTNASQNVAYYKVDEDTLITLYSSYFKWRLKLIFINEAKSSDKFICAIKLRQFQLPLPHIKLAYFDTHLMK